MTEKYILQAAVQAMTVGHHEAHCFHAHVQGKGYTNDGSIQADRADYLRQLAQRAQAEIDNMGFSPSYAEPGYEQPKRGILLANWNVFPSTIDTLLERYGFAVEWSDEWTTCSNCNKAMRTEPSSYDWTPAYTVEDGGEYCRDCKTEEEEPTFSV